MEWAILPLRRYAEFSGRSRPKEYWMFVLFVAVTMLVLTFVDSALGLGGTSERYLSRGPMGFAMGFSNSGGLLTALFALGVLVPSIAVGVRRLHDTDRSGWWLLIGLVPLIGTIVLLVFLISGGTRGPNRFGADPLELPASEV
jgi:uncharacterized membrane protein YhaH (DUF805 family)